MKHFTKTLKVQLLIFAVVVALNITNMSTKENNAVVTFLEKFLKPFLRATRVRPIEINTTVTNKERDLGHFILKKVTELKRLLDDNENLKEIEDNLTLQGNEETTVIEFLPETVRRTVYNDTATNKDDSFKSSINKYKQLREQIKTALDEELVSKETKTTILNTLDEMIAHMIESQCTWNSHPLRKQFSNSTYDSLSRVQSMSKKEWKKLRQQYVNYLKERNKKENLFMNEFHQFFSLVINETYNLSDRYKIRCQLVETHENEKTYPDKQALRGQIANKAKCPNFKICSDELRDFLTTFYIYLNDTAVSTFKNYAAMYVRDFGVDSEVVVAILHKIGHRTEGLVSKTYKNEVSNLELATNKDKNENIRLITDFIKSVSNEIKNVVKASMIKQLGVKKTKLYVTIKEDLLVNLEIDLDNLENYYIDTLCAKFLLCNGRYLSRRQGDDWIFSPKANNDIYVKVQVSLDDHMKDAVVKSGLLRMIENPGNLRYKYRNKNGTLQSYVVYNITRTTHSATNGNITTTKVKNNHEKHHKVTDATHKHHKVTHATHDNRKVTHETHSYHLTKLRDSIERNEITYT